MIESYKLAGTALVLSATPIAGLVFFLAVSSAWALEGGRSHG